MAVWDDEALAEEREATQAYPPVPIRMDLVTRRR